MSDHDATARRAEAVTIDRWEYDNPSWVVIAHHPVVTTAPDGQLLEEIEVQVQHRGTREGRGAGDRCLVQGNAAIRSITA
jgi:hypothetical protein